MACAVIKITAQRIDCNGCTEDHEREKTSTLTHLNVLACYSKKLIAANQNATKLIQRYKPYFNNRSRQQQDKVEQP